MRGTTLTYLSLFLFALALCAWIGAYLFLSILSSHLAARTAVLSSSATKNALQTNALELHAIVSGTTQGRSELDTLVSADVVGIANAIQTAGEAAGTKTTIGSADPIGATNAQSGVTELEYVVQSTGTFSQVWRAAELFGTLPLPSSTKELDFEKLPAGSTGQGAWQLTAHIDVLTSSSVSS